MNDELIVMEAPDGMVLTDGLVYAEKVMCDKKHKMYMNDAWHPVNLNNPSIPDDQALMELLEVLA